MTAAPPVDLLFKGGNVGRPEDPRLSRRAFARIRAMGPKGPHRDDPTVEALAEVDDDDKPDERAMISALWPAKLHNVWPPVRHAGQLVPVILDRDLVDLGRRPVHNDAVRISEGLPKVTPNRDVTLRRVDLGFAKPVTFAAFQLVAGAFTNPGQFAERERRLRWDEGWHGSASHPGVVDLFADEVRNGVTVIYYADTNRPRCPKVHPRERRVVQVGLDVLGVIPGKGPDAVRVATLSKGHEPSPVDGHVFPWASLRLTGRAS